MRYTNRRCWFGSLVIETGWKGNRIMYMGCVKMNAFAFTMACSSSDIMNVIRLVSPFRFANGKLVRMHII